MYLCIEWQQFFNLIALLGVSTADRLKRPDSKSFHIVIFPLSRYLCFCWSSSTGRSEVREECISADAHSHFWEPLTLIALPPSLRLHESYLWADSRRWSLQSPPGWGWAEGWQGGWCWSWRSPGMSSPRWAHSCGWPASGRPGTKTERCAAWAGCKIRRREGQWLEWWKILDCFFECFIYKLNYYILFNVTDCIVGLSIFVLCFDF